MDRVNRRAIAHRHAARIRSRRQYQSGLEIIEMAVVHAAFMEHVIDDAEMELLYDFILDDRTYLESASVGTVMTYKRMIFWRTEECRSNT